MTKVSEEHKSGMSQKNPPSGTLLSVFCRRPILIQGFGWIGGLGVLSSGIVWAQPDGNPDTLGGLATPQTIRSVKPEQSTATLRRTSPEPETALGSRSFASQREREPSVIRPHSVPESAQTVDMVPKQTRLRPPNLSVPTPLSEQTRFSTRFSANDTKPARGREMSKASDNNTYIDSADYSIGATARSNPRNRSYDAPDSVVLSERSTGCRRLLGTRQGLSSGICGSVAEVTSEKGYSANRYGLANQQDPVSRRQRLVADVDSGLVSRLGNPVVDNAVTRATALVESGLFNRRRESVADVESGVSSRHIRSTGSINQANVGSLIASATGIGMSSSGQGTTNSQSNSLSTQPFFDGKIPLPAPLPEGSISFIYPLSILAPITSVFGWRVHPITGDRRFHAGIDLGAPIGTPVLAAYAGQVALADWMGGYGLAVVLQHAQTQQTLYGHLSEVLVQPGQWVEQGTVIGKVGTTGNSTGPHLHFEWRQMTAEGWVATDPGTQLQYAMSQMMRALQTAQSTSPPGG